MLKKLLPEFKEVDPNSKWLDCEGHCDAPPSYPVSGMKGLLSPGIDGTASRKCSAVNLHLGYIG